MRVGVVVVWIFASVLVSVPDIAEAAGSPMNNTLVRSCGRSYPSHMRVLLSRLFASGDAADFQSTIKAAREIITDGEECSSNLPDCAAAASDCNDAHLMVETAVLVAEQYNTRSLVATSQSTEATASLTSEVQQTVYLCGMQGLTGATNGAQMARNALGPVLKSFATVHKETYGPAIDDHVTDLQQCASRISLDVLF